MKKRIQLLACLSCSIILAGAASLAWAHGEGKPGPHGGFIRMPGAFHTEVVPDGNDAFHVYVLDIHIANPKTEGTTMTAAHRGADGVEVPVECNVKDTFYQCRLPEGASLEQGQLAILAERDGVKGVEARYNLPLRFDRSHGDGR